MIERKEFQKPERDQNEQSRSLLDRWLLSIKNYPITAALLLGFMVIMGVGSMTGAIQQIISFLKPSQYTPQVIPPLEPPIIDRTPEQSHSISALTLKRVLEGQADDPASRIFEIVISNSSDAQIILNDFKIRWRYSSGIAAGIAEGASLKAIASYLIKLPIDPDNEDWNSKVEPIYPPIVLPPKNESGASLTTFQLQLHYFFSGRMKHHPSEGWKIIFDISVRTDKSRELSIFYQEPWTPNRTKK